MDNVPYSETNKHRAEENWRKKNANCTIQVQLEEDGGGSIRQRLMETSGFVVYFSPGVKRIA